MAVFNFFKFNYCTGTYKDRLQNLVTKWNVLFFVNNLSITFQFQTVLIGKLLKHYSKLKLESEVALSDGSGFRKISRLIYNLAVHSVQVIKKWARARIIGIHFECMFLVQLRAGCLSARWLVPWLPLGGLLLPLWTAVYFGWEAQCRAYILQPVS